MTPSAFLLDAMNQHILVHGDNDSDIIIFNVNGSQVTIERLAQEPKTVSIQRARNIWKNLTTKYNWYHFN